MTLKDFLIENNISLGSFQGILSSHRRAGKGRFAKFPKAKTSETKTRIEFIQGSLKEDKEIRNKHSLIYEFFLDLFEEEILTPTKAYKSCGKGFCSKESFLNFWRYLPFKRRAFTPKGYYLFLREIDIHKVSSTYDAIQENLKEEWDFFIEMRK